MKKALKKAAAILLSAAVTLTAMPFSVYAEGLSVTKSGGWYEYAFVQWTGSNNVTVEYKEKSADDSTYTKVDSELIGDNRVDIPGLKGEKAYTIKLTSADGSSATANITTMSYNRDGYAHFKGSDVGAYNSDGTLKSNADVIYVNNANKNTVKYSGYTGIGNILKNSGNISKPLAVRIIGKVDTQSRDADGSKTTDKNNGVVAISGLTDRDMGDDSYFNMCDMNQPKNLTIEGIGTDAYIEKWGLTLKGASGVEIRNLKFAKYPEDAIGMESSAKNIWVHNNSFEPGENKYDLTDEKDKGDGDGSTDIKKSDYITISDNYYHGCHKTSLIGGSTSHFQDYITFARNYFDATYERTPRVRNAHVHVYNNYYKGTTGYGIGASYNSKIFSEANYFENANVPITMGPVGSDKYGGTVKSYGDIFLNCGNTTNPDSSKTGTSYVAAAARDEATKINNPVNGGDAYDNFDINSSKFYYNSYSVMTAEEAKTQAATYSGILKADSGYNPGTGEQPTPPTPGIELLYGDADNSNALTSNDCAELIAKSLNSSYLTALEKTYPNDAFKFLDVNADGNITAADAAEVLTKVLDPSYSFKGEIK